MYELFVDIALKQIASDRFLYFQILMILFLPYRIWLCPKGPDDSQDPEQVGYMNIVPMVTEPGNIFINPKFESLSQTMKRFNDGLRTKTLPGRPTIP